MKTRTHNQRARQYQANMLDRVDQARLLNRQLKQLRAVYPDTPTSQLPIIYTLILDSGLHRRII